ncbi:MAG: protein-methionine-sulfoxide reductase heme-binding subunit MsrQ [Fluviicoccus sp.]|uniref:sulfite oxidase heme-binding subunit YedZ n=1 Tax=Fluviicoccus sp. TaxID=2003552 RepID=UPI0027165071|nr:protein-methionine-sulfoxide reductase heme-binding subunit MsrQ [Fluviicoccus sp.]MDO8331159.1 protein-methionine-sulfoxide reductase heme-binding subunit MsrQ [Fluviicoccus sp.]
MSPQRRAAIKRVTVFLILLLPLILMMANAMLNRLGPDPAKAVVDNTGLWAFRILLLCLAMTPLRIITGHSIWISYRRMLGLYALFYACLHLSAYAILLLGGDLAQLSKELVKRPYIVVGFSAWLLMIPLGVTSTKRWQKRLGKKWLHLHKAVYVTAVLGMLHFIWLKKLGIWAVWPYALILGALLILRLPVVKSVVTSTRTKKAT